MPIERIFLNWDKPLLPAAADFLLQLSSRRDFRDILIALPSGRSKRRLEELLVAKAGTGGILPPRILTPGELIDHICGVDETCCGSSDSLLAWADVLRQQESESLEALIPGSARFRSAASWLAVARHIEDLRSELAGAGHSFADLPEQVETLTDFDDHSRWSVLAMLEEAYLEKMRSLALEDRHQRRLAWLENAAPRALDFSRIMLVGLSDANFVSQQVLRKAAEHCAVTSVVFAPESEREGFNDLGCLRVDYWRGKKNDLQKARIIICRGPGEQGVETARTLAKESAAISTSDVIIGLADETLAPFIKEQVSAHGAPVRSAQGQLFSETLPGRLLQDMRAYLSAQNYAALGSLVRHPDILRYLQVEDPALQADTSALLVALDEYQTRHLQGRLARMLPGKDAAAEQARVVYEHLQTLLAGMMNAGKTLAAQAENLRGILAKIYVAQEDIDPTSEEALAAILRESAALEISAIARGLETNAADTLGILQAFLSQTPIAPGVQTPAVEMLGWLEVLHDDASHLILAGCNEGNFPQTVLVDPWLPNSLRAPLGLVDNDRRHARDSYALCAVLQAKEKVYLLAGQYSAQGDPLLPSRLLLPEETQKLTEAVRDFFSSKPQSSLSAAHVAADAQPPPRIVKAPETPAQLPASLSASQIKLYLNCPYQFYLRYILRLENLDDLAPELDASGFGSLIHQAFKRFGDSDLKTTQEADEIETFLRATVEEIIKERFGATALPAVRLQQEFLQARLRAFAREQAAMSAEGWEIAFVEKNFAPGACQLTCHVDALGQETSIGLHGCIDRIDYNRRDGRWRIIDYKTGDTKKGVENSHRPSPDEWLDVQLPLYLQLFHTLGLEGAVELAWFVLPAGTADTQVQVARWSAADLEEAVAVMRDVGTKVKRGEFFPPRTEKIARDFDKLFARGIQL